MTPFTRRSLLQTLSLGAGVPLLAPMISRLEAAEAGRPQPRFVFVIEGNGLPPTQVQPIGIPRATQNNLRNPRVRQSAEKSLIDLTLSDPKHQLPPSLEPLAKHQDRLTIIQGLSGFVCGGGHSNDYGALGCYSNRSGAKDITIDMALARCVPAIYQHVGLGISTSSTHNVIYGCSASGPNQKVPIYTNPSLAYEMLFGRILGKNPKVEVGAQAMLLDHVIGDIKRLEKQLPAAERHKLERYWSAFESIGNRQARLGEIDRKLIHKPNDKYNSSVETDRLTAHFEITATALISGLTNVVTIASGAGSPHFSVTFKGLGINVDKHQIGHRSTDDAVEQEVKIRQFHMRHIADLMDRLASVPEGNGTMLDNTLIVYLSDSAEAHHSTCYEWPIVLAGGLTGKLKTGDRFLNYPRYGIEGHRTVANLYTTLLHAAGKPVTHFGQKDPELEGAIDQHGPLAELLA